MPHVSLRALLRQQGYLIRRKNKYGNSFLDFPNEEMKLAFQDLVIKAVGKKSVVEKIFNKYGTNIIKALYEFDKGI